MTPPRIRRRPRLVLGAVAAATVVAGVGAAGLVSAAVIGTEAPPCEACGPFTTGQPLASIPAQASSGGVLSTTLTAATRTVPIGGRRISTQTYGSRLFGDAWVISPGDHMDVLLRNRLPRGYVPYGQWGDAWFQPKGGNTNIHVHGLHVSPNEPSDDILLNIRSGSDYQYRYDIPQNQEPGIYWYHPHVHHFVDMQTFAGQAGPIVVRGGLDNVPGVGDLRDRWMFIQNTMVLGNATAASQYAVPSRRIIPINGQVQPTVDFRPGESQRLRLWNASTERFLRIRPAAGDYWVLAVDGETFDHPVRKKLLVLGPGQRMEVLARAPRTPGRYQMIQQYFSQRPTPYGKQPEVNLATMVVGGAPVAPQAPPRSLVPPGDQAALDLRGADIAVRRRVVFTQNPGIASFYVNGKRFDAHGKITTMYRPRVNTNEEWLIVNHSPEWHNFHIHINPYQIVARDGKPVQGQPEWADSANIPPNHSITIRQRFADFTGKFVFHCHVLVHEDHGMMAAIEVRE